MTRNQNNNQCSGSHQTLTAKKKKLHESSKFKVMLIVLFDIQGVVMAEWVPSGQTVN
jgi:hypothetical protein